MENLTAERRRLMRFAAVSAAAGAIDYLLAAGLILLGMSAFLALAISICLTGGLSFVVHELWTFGTEGLSARCGRLLRWAMLVAFSLGVRFGVLHGVENVLPAGDILRLIALAIAFGVSAATNYLLSRLVVFSVKA
jgi:putative flippase GtrA